MRYLFIMLTFNKSSNYDYGNRQLPTASHQLLLIYLN